MAGSYVFGVCSVTDGSYAYDRQAFRPQGAQDIYSSWSHCLAVASSALDLSFNDLYVGGPYLSLASLADKYVLEQSYICFWKFYHFDQLFSLIMSFNRI